MTRILFGFIIFVSLFLRNGINAEAADTPSSRAIGHVRIELIYERYNRDVELSGGRFSATGPAATVPFVLPNRSALQEEERVSARLHFPTGRKIDVYLDAGMSKPEGSEGVVPIFGGGIRLLAYKGRSFDASIVGFGTYVPKIEYKASTLDPSLGNIESEQEESYWEAGIGLELHRSFTLKKGFRFKPFGGFAVSFLRGDEDFLDRYTNLGVTVIGTANLEEDGLLSLYGGFSFLLNRKFSLRIEGRFVNQTSLSAGLAFIL